MRSAIDHFEQIAPAYMRSFLNDFKNAGVIDLDCAAVFGNAGTESVGLTVLQEIHPVIRGSRGGFGWFQWTGKRRVLFEDWCRDRALNPSHDEANYGFLSWELTHTEKTALVRMRAAQGLNDKVSAFERYFEGAGVPNLNSRLHWAQIALDAFHKKYYPPIERK